MEKLIEFIIKMVKKTTVPFVVSVLFVTIFGYFAGEQIATISKLCTATGVPYSSLFELLALSLLVGMINMIFDMPFFMKEVRLLYKIMLRVFFVVIITIIFIGVFDWFPFDNIEAWIGFIVSFGLCFGISFLISLYLTHKKDKQYQVLLEKYKERGQ